MDKIEENDGNLASGVYRAIGFMGISYLQHEVFQYGGKTTRGMIILMSYLEMAYTPFLDAIIEYVKDGAISMAGTTVKFSYDVVGPEIVAWCTANPGPVSLVVTLTALGTGALVTFKNLIKAREAKRIQEEEDTKYEQAKTRADAKRETDVQKRRYEQVKTKLLFTTAETSALSFGTIKTSLIYTFLSQLFFNSTHQTLLQTSYSRSLPLSSAQASIGLWRSKIHVIFAFFAKLIRSAVDFVSFGYLVVFGKVDIRACSHIWNRFKSLSFGCS